MKISNKQLEAITEEFTTAKRFVLICHGNPDGDALGSLLGLGLLLEREFKEKEVVFHCEDPSPDTFSYLFGIQRLTHNFKLKKSDLVIILDSGVPRQTKLDSRFPELFDQSRPVINIDHHKGNPKFGTINIINEKAASTCEIIVKLADAFNWELTPDIATALLTGVYTDTGGLLHSNTTAEVYATTARLLRAGANQQQIVKAVFRTTKMSTLKLWGRVLEKISLTEDGGALSAITDADFRATGAHHSELTGAIDYVNAVPGMRFSLILSDRDGIVKGSLRTLRDDVDVAEMAGAFDGGGHKKAAGFSLPGKLEPEVRWKVVE